MAVCCVGFQRSGHLVITADFRDIAFEDGPRKCEGLFRASIAAFANIPRPTRNEIAQIDDLAIGLYDSVSREAKHYAATVLSKCTDVPPELLKRLCEEPVDVSAPLLISSKALRTIDLLRLISKHGLSHARVIARRKNVDPVIVNLVRLLNARAESEIAERQSRERAPNPVLDQVRDQLRTLISSAEPTAPEAAPATVTVDHDKPYPALRDAALASDPDAFPSALAKVLNISGFRARRICGAITYGDLLTCLKHLDLNQEQAFLLTATLYSSQVFYGPAIRLFLDRFAAIKPEDAAQRLGDWRKQDAAANVSGSGPQSAAISR